MSQPSSARRYWHHSWCAQSHWQAAILVAVLIDWFAKDAHQFVERVLSRHLPKSALVFRLALFAVVLGCAMEWLYRRRRDFALRLQTRTLRVEQADPHPHLVLFLSKLPASSDDSRFEAPEGFTPSNNLRADIERLAELKESDRTKTWSWEMPLRALAHHAVSLRKVYVFASPESLSQLPWFAQLLSGYDVLRNVAVVGVVNKDGRPEMIEASSAPQASRGWRFDDLDQLARGFRKFLALLTHQHGVREHEIMIDFTGGQKPISVVAAVATINRHVKAQYVDTTKPHNVISYDLVMDPSEETGLEI